MTASLRNFVSLSAEFRIANADQTELRRRAEVLSPAIARLWSALEKERVAEPAGFKAAMDAANANSRKQDLFDPAAYANQLAEMQKAIESLPKP